MIILVLILLILALLFPYGWSTYHRLRLIGRLRKKGEQFGIALHPLRRLPYVSKNLSTQYDFYMEGADVIYPVKLFSSCYRGRSLIVGPDGRIAERRTVRAPLEPRRGARERKVSLGKWHAVPMTKPPKLGKAGKRIVPILLNYPTYDCILHRQEGKEILLTQGSILFQKRIETPSTFEKLLFEESKRG
jgi:hypothetical protein